MLLERPEFSECYPVVRAGFIERECLDGYSVL